MDHHPEKPVCLPVKKSNLISYHMRIRTLRKDGCGIGFYVWKEPIRRIDAAHQNDAKNQSDHDPLRSSKHDILFYSQHKKHLRIVYGSVFKIM